MRPIDLLGGPTRSVEQVGEAYRLTVTPPAWSGYSEGSQVVLTADQHSRYVQWMQTGALIQEALPDLSPSEREIILTGISPKEWDYTMRDDEEDYDEEDGDDDEN